MTIFYTDFKIYECYRFVACSVLVLLSGISFSCAGIEPKQQAAEPVAIRSEPKVPDQEEDIRKDGYTNFILASLNIARGNYEEARNLLTMAVENDPDSIYLNKKMAILLQKLKDSEGALRYALKSVELDPNDIGSRLLLAELYSIAGDKESEKGEYETILNINPKHQRVRLILATVLIRSRQLDEAMKHLDELVKQNPDMIIAYYYRGRVHLELRNYHEAEQEYLHALALSKNMEPALFDLASLYQMQKSFEKAVEVYKKLLSFYPANRVAKERLINLYNKLGQEKDVQELIDEIKRESKPGEPGRQALGYFYLQNGKIEESITELDLIVSAWPRDYKSRYYLALAYEENGQPEKALEHFRQIKKGTEYFINSRRHMASILDDMGKYDEAIDLIQKAIEAEKEEIDLYLILASLFESKKEYGKAMEVIKEGLKYDEKDINLIFRLGVVLDKAGDKEGSIAHMRRILEINPDHAESLNYIGYTYAEKGIRLNEAMELIQKALKIKPNSGYIIDSLGWAYFQKGLYDKALESLNKAFSLISDDPTIAEHLGDVYLKKSQYKRSLEMYQKALSLKHQFIDKIKEKIEEVKKFLE
ncbi:tetratricopeptide repeat protein [Thermodesulfobacteriota bacterium]